MEVYPQKNQGFADDFLRKSTKAGIWLRESTEKTYLVFPLPSGQLRVCELEIQPFLRGRNFLDMVHFPLCEITRG